MLKPGECPNGIPDCIKLPDGSFHVLTCEYPVTWISCIEWLFALLYTNEEHSIWVTPLALLPPMIMWLVQWQRSQLRLINNNDDFPMRSIQNNIRLLKTFASDLRQQSVKTEASKGQVHLEIKPHWCQALSHCSPTVCRPDEGSRRFYCFPCHLAHGCCSLGNNRPVMNSEDWYGKRKKGLGSFASIIIHHLGWIKGKWYKNGWCHLHWASCLKGCNVSMQPMHLTETDSVRHIYG